MDTLEKRIRTERNAGIYTELTDVEHVYQIPDTYIGSTEPETRVEYLLDIQNLKLVMAEISLSRGIERLFLEILSNAGDNADNSRRAGVNPGSIDITMDRKWIRIRNGGQAIPVTESTSSPGKLVPDVIFGKLRSSSNYDATVVRMGCGRNGFGAKLTNIFSKAFKVTVGDNVNKRLYNGAWENNMKNGPMSKVESYYEPYGFVEICWYLDFERFGLKEYPDEAFALFARYAADFSLTCKIPVSFNGVKIDVRNIRNYAKLYFNEEQCDKAILHYEWNGANKDHPNGLSPFGASGSKECERLISEAKKADHIPIIELMILDTPDEGVCLSYVNGLLTIDGGVHVQEAFSSLSTQILEIVNTSAEKKKKKDDTKTPKLNIEDIKRHTSIILNCRLPDPKYTSQSKTRVSNPKPHISIPKKMIDDVLKWDLITRLYAALEEKMFNALKKTNGGRVKHIQIDSGEDANFAGTEKSGDCILYLVEGKSAAAYPRNRITASPGGKDLGGYYPLRGKFMNVRNFNLVKVAENKEVIAIKKLVGLREGLDYSQVENAITLRYGFIMICVDADSDGFHIASLLINYIHKFFAGLLAMGRVAILRTPTVRIYDSRGNIIHRFYSASEFTRWETAQKSKPEGMKGLRIVYYKGLAKSSNAEIKDDIATAPVVSVIYDEEADNSLSLAFEKGLANKRKEWIAKWREVSGVDDITFEGTGIFRQQKITDFINRELIDYTKDALFRAIPSQDDGLKRSHRQALYAGLKYFKFGRKSEEPNVARFAAFAANETNYHHGETSMCDTIIKMAQNFTGSNNLPFFRGIGQFGDREDLGEHAGSPRYLHVNMPAYTPLLYDEELIGCIPKRVIEGDEVEPMYVPAVIPMHLINGALGIATGYSSFIPNHSYYDIIGWCKNRCINPILNGKTIIKPWYKNFNGTIEFMENKSIVDGEDDNEDIEEPEDDPEEDETSRAMRKVSRKKASLSIITRGKCEVSNSRVNVNINITEVPIMMSALKYKNFLSGLVKEKIIADFNNKSNENSVNFFIKGWNPKAGGAVNFKNLHLEHSLPLTNITLIDENGYPTKYKNTNDVLEVYAKRMLDLYGKVKENRIRVLKEKIEDLNYRIRFISLVLDGKIVVFKRAKKDVLADMAAQKPPIPERYFTSVKLYECTKEELDASRDEITKYNKDYESTLKLTSEQLWLGQLENLESYLKKNKF